MLKKIVLSVLLGLMYSSSEMEGSADCDLSSSAMSLSLVKSPQLEDDKFDLSEMAKFNQAPGSQLSSEQRAKLRNLNGIILMNEELIENIIALIKKIQLIEDCQLLENLLTVGKRPKSQENHLELILYAMASSCMQNFNVVEKYEVIQPSPESEFLPLPKESLHTPAPQGTWKRGQQVALQATFDAGKKKVACFQQAQKIKKLEQSRISL